MKKIKSFFVMATAIFFAAHISGCAGAGGETQAKAPATKQDTVASAPPVKTDTTAAVPAKPDTMVAVITVAKVDTPASAPVAIAPKEIDTVYYITPLKYGVSQISLGHPTSDSDDSKKNARLVKMSFNIHIKLDANGQDMKFEISEQDKTFAREEDDQKDSIVKFNQEKFKSYNKQLGLLKTDTLLVKITESGEPGKTSKKVEAIAIKGKKEIWSGTKVSEEVPPKQIWPYIADAD